MLKYRVLLFAILVLLLSGFGSNLSAQQGKGLFISVFGKEAPNTYGDFNNVQAIYFDVPISETKPIYLRLFDADIGGNYDEMHGGFNTSTRFTVIGGKSASQIFGGNTYNANLLYLFDYRDVIEDKTFKYSSSYDARWTTLTELRPEDGYSVGAGYLRYVLLVQGGEGDDGNFFDFALSYSKTRKEPPPNTKIFTYDLSLRIPSLSIYNFDSFQGQFKIETNNQERIEILTFDMDDVPIDLYVPFQPNVPLKTSGDGEWVSNIITIPNGKNINLVGLNFYGRPFNNTFAAVAKLLDGTLLPIQMPILDYEPPKIPEFSYSYEYSDDECRSVTFFANTTNADLVSNLTAKWMINDNLFTGKQTAVSFDSHGYHPFEVHITGSVDGGVNTFSFYDSILVNLPPVAFSGGNRAIIPGESMAFDGTVSHDPDGKISKYHWDFGDGTTEKGARIDKIYSKPGTYTLVLTVYDDSNTPCNLASDTATVKVNLQPLAKINAPDIVQLGETFLLDGTESTDPDGKIISYLWQIGSDTLLQGSQVYYALNSEVNTPVILQVLDDAQTFNSIHRAYSTIKVNKRPIAIAGNDKVVSPGRPATFDARDSYDKDGKIIDYEWNFNGLIKQGAVVEHGFTTPGEYIVYLTVTDDSQKAIGIDSMFVIVNHPPIPIISGATQYLTGRIQLDAFRSYDQDGSILEYTWRIDGKTFKGDSLVYNFDKPGTYEVELVIIDDSRTYSSVQSIKEQIKINQLPIAELSIPKELALGQPTTFKASNSYDPDGKIIEYFWDLGDGTTAMGEVVVHKYDNPGTYQIQLRVKDDSYLAEAVTYDYGEIRVNQKPELIVKAPEIVAPNETAVIELTESYDPDGSISTYQWFIDDKWVKGEAKHEFKIGRIDKNIRFRITDNSHISNSTVEGIVVVKVNNKPIAKGNPPIRSARKLIVFDGSASSDPDGDKLKYYWDFGDGISKEGPIVINNYSYGGRFKAILTVDDQRGLQNSYDYDTVNVFINRPPEVFFEIPYVVCVGDSFKYDGSKTYDPDGSFMTYEWAFGDNQASRSGSGNHVYSQIGRYQVTLTVDDNEGLSNSVSSYSQFIDVVGSPKAEAGKDFIACQNESVQFDGSLSKAAVDYINEYIWDFGDGNTSSGPSPVYLYSEPGTYKVTLTVVGNKVGSCSNQDSDELYVTVIPEPKANFKLPAVARIADTLSLDPSSSVTKGHTITSIEWAIDDTIKYTWIKESQFDSVTSTNNRFWRLYRDGFSTNQTVGDRSSENLLPVLELSLNRGDHSVRLQIDSESVARCGSSNLTRFISVRDKPQFAISNVPVLAPGVPFTFSGAELNRDLDQIARAFWKFGDGTSGEGIVATHSYEKPGMYEIEFMADDGYGTSSSITRLMQTVKVNASPVAEIEGPNRALSSRELQYEASSSYDPDGSIIDYQWFFSDGFRARGKTVKHKFTQNGVYNVTLTVVDDAEAPNSVQTTNRVVSIADAPELTMKLPTVICPGFELDIIKGLSVNATDSSLLEIYIGNSQISYSQARSQVFNFPGIYNLRVILNDGSSADGGSSVIRQSIRVNGPPEIYATVPKTVTIGAANEFAKFDASNTFDPNGDVLRYYWDFGDGKKEMGKTINHVYKQAGEYEVKLMVMDANQLNCSVAEKTFKVKVIRK